MDLENASSCLRLLGCLGRLVKQANKKGYRAQYRGLMGFLSSLTMSTEQLSWYPQYPESTAQLMWPLPPGNPFARRPT